MPNHKIFWVIVGISAVMVLGLEWLPSLFEVRAPYPQPQDASAQTRVGLGIISYFVVLSVLIYIKILLQRPKQ